MNIKNTLLLMMHIFLGFQASASQYAKHLPVRIRQERIRPSLSQESLPKLEGPKEQENNYPEDLPWKERLHRLKQHGQINVQEGLLANKDMVFIKTNDDKIMGLSRWQINEMPVLFKRLSQEKQNSPMAPLDCSLGNGGMSSQELQLLSDTWINMRRGGALDFIHGLSSPPESLDKLSLLSGAADKVESKLLHAITVDFLLPKEVLSSSIKKLTDPMITFLKQKGKFIFVKKEQKGFYGNVTFDQKSPDGTKWLGTRLQEETLDSLHTSVLLYNKADNFRPRELLAIVKPGYFEFRFDSGSKMVFGIPKIADGEFFCADINDEYKKYIQYKGFIGDVECLPDRKTIIFTQGKEFGKEKGNELYVCELTRDDPKPYKIASMENPITAIAVNPNNEQFICIAGEKLCAINKAEGAFKVSTILWTEDEKIKKFFAEQEVTKDHLQPIQKAVFNSSGTKLICILEYQAEGWNKLLLLYSCIGNDYALEKMALIPFRPNEIDCVESACVMSGSYGRIYYWKIDDLSDPRMITKGLPSPYNANIKMKLSHDGRRVLFSEDNDGIVQCCDYSNFTIPYFTPIPLDEEKQYKNIDSIQFSPDDKQALITYRGPDSDNQDQINVIEKCFSFDPPQFTLGEAQVLHSLWYAHILKRDSEVKKGTLSYELFQKLPETLRSKMIYVFKLKVIDQVPDQQESDTLAAEEISPENMQQIEAMLAMENLREYSKQSKHVPLEEQKQRAEIPEEKKEEN